MFQRSELADIAPFILQPSRSHGVCNDMGKLTICVLTALSAVLCAAGQVRADSLEADADHTRIRELDHHVAIAIRDGYAVYTVTRTFAHTSQHADTMHVTIDIPYGAYARGFAVQRTSQWATGVLLDAEEAERVAAAAAELAPATQSTSPTASQLSNNQSPPPRPPRLATLREVSAVQIETSVVIDGVALTNVRYELVVPPDATTEATARYTYPSPGIHATPRLVVTEIAPAFDERTLQLNAAAWALHVERRVRRASRADRQTANLRRNAKHSDAPSTAINDDAEGVTAFISVRPHRMRWRLQSAELAPARDRALFWLDATIGQLSDMPIRPNVVFVIDLSHSMTRAGLTRAVRLAQQFVARVPDAKYSIVTFARRVVTYQDWAPAATTQRALRALLHAPLQNGSELAAALQHAKAHTQTGPGKPEARVVAFTDADWRSDLTETDFLQATRNAHATMHTVVIGSSGVNPIDEQCLGICEADEYFELTQAMRATGGMACAWVPPSEPAAGLLSAQGSRSSPVPPGHTQTAEAAQALPPPDEAAAVTHLVRPTRLVDVHWVYANAQLTASPREARSAEVLAINQGNPAHAPARPQVEAVTPPPTALLAEYDALRVALLVPANERIVGLAGYLWGKRVEFPFTHAPAFTAPAAGLLLHSEIADELSTFEQMALARMSHSVSGVTTLVVDGRRVQTATERAGVLSGRKAHITCGLPATIGHIASAQTAHGIAHGISPPTIASWNHVLAGPLRQCVRLHTSPSNWRVELEVERSKNELLNVVIANQGATPLQPWQACIVDAFWAHTLTGAEPASPMAYVDASIMH